MRRRSSSSALAALLLLGATSPLAGQSVGSALEFEEYYLANGLRVVLAPEHSVPVVNVNLWYRVGSRDEPPGLTGFAHLFEHMMFEGSANVAKGEHHTYIERAGGSHNATVNTDRTLYFQTVPANRLNLVLWLEADRLRSLDVSQFNLDNQRDVVKEEKRRGVLNQPYTRSFLEALYMQAYDAETCFAQGHMPIGHMEDLDAATLEDVRRFHEVYYKPNNGTLVVAGDFEPAVAKALIEEYFGDIASGADPPPVECRDAFGHLPVRHVQPDPHATIPAIIFSYGAVERNHGDAPALDLLARILGEGEASRLHQRLVQREQAALDVGSFPDFRVDPGVVVFLGIANQGVEIEELERLLEEEIARVREEGVTDAELTRARNQYLAGRAFGQQTVMGLAEALQHAVFYYDDPAAVDRIPQLYEAVTTADIRRVARRYLDPRNRATVIAQPAPATEE
jgi:zinc protease